MQKLLIVDDNAEYRKYLEGILKSPEFSISFSADAESARQACENSYFDLILLDLSLPDMNGFELLAELRKNQKNQASTVLFLTDDSKITSKLAAFSLGADDYIVKGIDPLEFRSKIETKVRNLRLGIGRGSGHLLIRGDVRIDLEAYSASLCLSDGSQKDLDLTTIEFKLLHLLAKNDGRVLSRDQILSQVWGEGVNVFDRVIDTHIYALRKKLDSHSYLIASVQNVGYRFVSDRKPEIEKKTHSHHSRLKSKR